LGKNPKCFESLRTLSRRNFEILTNLVALLAASHRLPKRQRSFFRFQEPLRHEPGGQAEPRAVRVGHVADPTEASRKGPAGGPHARHGAAVAEVEGVAAGAHVFIDYFLSFTYQTD
jgi:hypothetical protein